MASIHKTAVRLLISCVLGLALFTVPAAVSAAGGPDHPVAPPGFQRNLDPPAGASVSEEIVTLPAAQCAAMNQALTASGKAAQADCRVIHRSYGKSHQALPAGTLAAAPRGLFGGSTVYAAAAYWYWSWWDQECSLYGCWYWGVSLTEDGVANGSNVWQWSGAQCTASGVDNFCTWSGYFHNGGGWPTFGMQFGENSCVLGAVINGAQICVGHGQRRWINDWGNPAGYSYW